MMPNNSLSQTKQVYSWKGLNIYDPSIGVDYEEGGVGINDTSMGLRYQLWTFTVEGSAVYAESTTTGKVLLFNEPSAQNVQEIAGCFDQNMQPFVAYKSAGSWHYRWWDVASSSFVISDLPNGVTSCRCTLDDKRDFETAVSDVLLFYTLNNNLYHRRQRDRYTVELLVRASIEGVLIKVNMNAINRLQIKLQVVR